MGLSKIEAPRDSLVVPLERTESEVHVDKLGMATGPLSLQKFVHLGTR